MTNRELKRLIETCEEYLERAPRYHHHGFCAWALHYSKHGIMTMHFIQNHPEAASWLRGLYVSRGKGRTPRREAFVWDLHRIATEHLSARRAATERDLQR